MKKMAKKSATQKVTSITSVQRRGRKAASVQAEAIVARLVADAQDAVVEPAVEAITAFDGTPKVRKDRAAEYLVELGLVDAEIARLRSALPIIPIDVELVGRARAFVAANLSGWDHKTWLAFLEELGAEGYDIGSDGARHFLAQKFIGSLLETLRVTEYQLVTDTERFEKAA